MADLELKVTIPYTFNVKAAPVQPVTVTPGSPEVILVPVPGGKGDKGDTGASGDGAQVFGETPTSITFSDPPISGDTIRIDYTIA
jgi:hypothetical protein